MTLAQLYKGSMRIWGRETMSRPEFLSGKVGGFSEAGAKAAERPQVRLESTRQPYLSIQRYLAIAIRRRRSSRRLYAAARAYTGNQHFERSSFALWLEYRELYIPHVYATRLPYKYLRPSSRGAEIGSTRNVMVSTKLTVDKWYTVPWLWGVFHGFLEKGHHIYIYIYIHIEQQLSQQSSSALESNMIAILMGRW